MIFEKKIITDYESLQIKISQLINHYGIKKKVVYNHLGISKTTFNRKLKEQSFTIKEMFKIADFFGDNNANK